MEATFKNNSERTSFKKAFPITCKSCGILAEYNEQYDAYYCSECGDWLEPKCTDPDCELCKDRPDKPDKEGNQ